MCWVQSDMGKCHMNELVWSISTFRRIILRTVWMAAWRQRVVRGSDRRDRGLEEDGEIRNKENWLDGGDTGKTAVGLAGWSWLTP